MYITVKDLINEGVEGNKNKLQKAILMAEAYIDKMTEQFFEKKTKSYYFDGGHTKVLHLPIFCLKVNYIKENDEIIDEEDFTLYNRFSPDDRLNPKIVFERHLNCGLLNIEVNGDFGYVEEDESTPLLIQKICKKLAMVEVIKFSDPTRRDLIDRGRIISEETDGHSYDLGRILISGEYTGDPEIDGILMKYKRPLSMGGV